MTKNLEVYSKNGELSASLKEWLNNFIGAGADESNENVIIAFEQTEVAEFCKVCKNQAVLEVVDTDNLKDITTKITKTNTYVLIKAKEEVSIEQFFAFENHGVDFFICINVDNNLKHKFQIGVLYPKN